MGPFGAGQSPVLSEILGEVCLRLRPRRLAVLGAGTGNGFEHIDPMCTTKVTAIDVNPGYLAILRARHPGLASVLDTICAPVEECERAPESIDVVHAALIFEYTEPAALVGRVAAWLVSGGVLSVVLQLPSDQPAVTPTRYESMRLLDGFMHLVPPEELTRHASSAGLALMEARDVPMRSGKRFWTGRYKKHC